MGVREDLIELAKLAEAKGDKTLQLSALEKLSSLQTDPTPAQLDPTATPIVSDPGRTRGQIDAPRRELRAARSEAVGQLEKIQAGELDRKDLTPEQFELVKEESLNQIPEILSSGVLAGENAGDIAKFAALLAVTPNTQEAGQILNNLFPNVAITHQPGGRVFAVNTETGKTGEINKPGPSVVDLAQGVGIATSFTPGATLAARSAGGLLFRGGAKSAAAQQIAVKGGAQGLSAGITEEITQRAQEAGGGELNEEDVKLAASFGLAGELVLPFIVNIKNLVKAGVSSDEAIRQAARDADVSDDAIRAFDERQAIIQTGEEKGVEVFTSDIFPPETAAGGLARQAVEKIPFIGTGGARAAQQDQRVKLLRDFATDSGVDVDSPLEAIVVKGLSDKQKANMAKAVNIRRSVFDRMENKGEFQTPQVIDRIDALVAREQKLGERANQGLINELESIKTEFLKGGDFQHIANLRTTVIRDIKKLQKGEHEVLSSADEAALQSVKSAIDRGMLRFAREQDPQVAKDWLKSNSLFADEFTKFKQSELKRLISKGDLTPEQVLPVIFGGKRSQLARLNNNITSKGRNGVQAIIIRDLMIKAGFPDNISPDKFATEINKPQMKKAIKTFFPESQRKQIKNVEKLLNATRRAQQADVVTPTGQQLIPFAAGAALNLKLILGAGSVAAAGRAYESKQLRNLLNRFEIIPKGSAQELQIGAQVLDQVTRAQTEGNVFDK